MTTLTRNLRRETSASYRGRALMIDAGKYGVAIREKGKRNGYYAPWEAVFTMAAKLQAAQQRRERMAQRGKRK